MSKDKTVEELQISQQEFSIMRLAVNQYLDFLDSQAPRLDHWMEDAEALNSKLEEHGWSLKSIKIL